MSEYSSIVEREMERMAPPSYSLVDVRRRRNRRQRNKRIVSAITALAIATAALGILFKVFESGAGRPANGPITPSNVSDLRLLGTGPGGGNFAVSDGLVYVANGETHDLEAYPVSCYGVRTSCKPTWVAPLGHAESPLVEAGGGNVYVSAGAVYAFAASCGTDGATCEPTWVGKIPGRPGCVCWGFPELGRDTVYVPGPHRLYAFPTSCTGRCRPGWVSSKLPVGAKYAVVSGDTVFVPTEGASQNVAFPAHCAADGSVCPPSGAWNVPHGGGVPVFADGELLISSGEQLWVYPKSCAVGRGCQPLWSSPFGGSLAAADGKVFVLSHGTVRAVPTRCDAPPCQPSWEAHGLPTGPSPAGGGMVAANGVLFVSDHTAARNGPPNGGIYAFPTACGSGDTECKPLWTWGTAEHIGIEGLTVAGSRVYIHGGDVFGIESSARAPAGRGARAADPSRIDLYGVVAALAILLALVQLTRRRRVSESTGNRRG